MFLIVPKPKTPRTTPRTTPSGEIAGHAQPQTHESRGPVRSQVACDVCRLRKSKCNGQRPCGLCRKKGAICVYSRSSKRDLPRSSGPVELLQRQQTRLVKTMREMASIISGYEDGSQKPPAEFDVTQLLDKYAPDVDDDAIEMEASLLPEENPAGSAKRPRCETSGSYGEATAHKLPATAKGAVEKNRPRGSDPHVLGDRAMEDAAFTLEPGPAFFDASSASGHQSDSYEAMLQFCQLMNSNDNTNGTSNQTTTSPLPASLAPTSRLGSSRPPEDATHWLMDLVDWRASLENFPDSDGIEAQWTHPEPFTNTTANGTTDDWTITETTTPP